MERATQSQKPDFKIEAWLWMPRWILARGLLPLNARHLAGLPTINKAPPPETPL